MLERAKAELLRLDATDVYIELDHEFEPNAGVLIKVSHNGAVWRLLPGKLEELAGELPDGAGGDAIRQAIETKAHAVWRGSSPSGSRDSSQGVFVIRSIFFESTSIM